MQTNEQNEVKFCPYCGTKSFGKGVFCHQCGQKLLINVESDNNDVTTTPSVDLSADGNTDNLTQEGKSSNKIDNKAVKKVTAIVLAIVAFVVVLGIILGGGKGIVGQWHNDDEGNIILESNKDMYSYGEYCGTYEYSNKRLTLYYEWGDTEEFEVKLNGDTMIWYVIRESGEVNYDDSFYWVRVDN